MTTLADPRETYTVPFREALKPPPDLTVWEWSDEHRVLSQVASAEPGRWVTDRTPYLREILECLSPSCPVRKVIFRKSAQVGGPLALDTPIPTVDGWTTMGDVAVGDWLFDELGQPCRVQSVSPVMRGRDCYRVRFDDGEAVVCDAAHRWPVWDFTSRNPKLKTLTIGQMLGRVRIGKRYRYAIDTCKPTQLPERDLLVHPYVLGVWLGDGNSIMNHISVEETDAEVADHLNACGVAAVFRLPTWRKGKCANIVVDPTPRLADQFEREGPVAVRRHTSAFTRALRFLDVLDNKHIPEAYLRASHKQRLALLQGLMDSDGTITPDGKRCEFSNINRHLVDGVVELLGSLGYKTSVYPVKPKTKAYPGGRICTSQPSWRVSWTAYREEPMFRLSRKLRRMGSIEQGRPSRGKRRRIVAIEPVPPVPVRCIEVDSPNHLYLCGRGWIPTHNTEAGNNWVAFVVDMVGGPMLIVQPTVELAKRWSKQRLAPMIRDTPRLYGKITDARSRDSGNTMLAKEFPGGILIVTGANSAIGLRSMPAASLFFDEVDAYPDSVNGEGHAIELGERRAQTFPFRKIFEVSTPKLKYASRIDDDFESSDRAFFYVPCPECGAFQRLVHTNLVYEEEAPHAALYACGACGDLLREGHKTRMLAQGQWFRRVDEPEGVGPVRLVSAEEVPVLDHGDGWWGPRPPDPNRP
ncbi:MAG: phage terminase large subunit family protein, partial [Leptospirillia bacterium]